MAEIIGSANGFDKLDKENYQEFDARTTKLMDELQEQSDNLPNDVIIGGIITFPIADGRAYYQVANDKPLQLVHLPFMDAWHASEITIRGLNVDDVKLMLKRSKSMPRLKPMPVLPTVKAAAIAVEPKRSEEVTVDVRFVNALASADDAFWAAIAQAYPEIKTGDLSPDVVVKLKTEMEIAVASWLKVNVPEGTSLENLVHSDFLTENDEESVMETIPVNLISSTMSERDKVVLIKETYPVGTRVRLDAMKDDPNPVEDGTFGTINSVDDAGQLHVKWDNNRSLALIPGVDEFTVLDITLDEFVASKKWSENIERDIGFNNGNPNLKGYIYRGTFYIEKLENGRYLLSIERDEFESEILVELEVILYNRHFKL